MVHGALFVLAIVGLLVSLRTAAGRLAPQAAFAPILFLVTRVPILIVWGLGAVGWVVVLLPQAIGNGHADPGDLLTLLGISVLCGGGVAALVVGPVFLVSRLFVAAPVFVAEPGETVAFEVRVTHFLGGEARGGVLFVTSRRLAFRPDRFNVQLDPWSAPLADLAGFQPEGTRFLVLRSRTGAPDEWLTVPSGSTALAERLTASLPRS